MLSTDNSDKKRQQVNVKFSDRDFSLLEAAAKAHSMEPATFCRNAALAACGGDLAPQETPLLKAVAGLLANLEGEIVKLRADLTGVITGTHLHSLAALEEILGVRVILTNAAEIISRGEKFREGDMKALVGTANASKTKAATRALAVLTDRLNHPATQSIADDATASEATNA